MVDENQTQDQQQNNNQQQATPDYKKLYEENQAKFKDVDLDKYNRAKDFDFDKAQEALEFKEAQEAERLKKEQEEANKDPINKLTSELGQVKQTLAQREKADREKAQSDWMKQYHSGIDSSIEMALKGDFKDLEELSPAEKKLVKLAVNDAFEQDSRQKVQKLNLGQINSVVADAIKEVKENRTFVTSRQVKRGPSNPALPTAQDGAAPKQLMTTGQKIEAMAEHMRSAK